MCVCAVQAEDNSPIESGSCKHWEVIWRNHDKYYTSTWPCPLFDLPLPGQVTLSELCISSTA